MQCVDPAGGRRLVLPQVGDEGAGGDEFGGGEREPGEEQTDAAAARGDRPPVAVAQFEWAQKQ
ncbi:hypothetical protein [Streptomyces somaliensis]|uniref:hypothetical protein n=1 Tax=Streptomyces somaliensis TaxID=78355 RepID=UPI0034E952A4|nr:hypothetical protein [Streptomyces somaliensis]